MQDRVDFDDLVSLVCQEFGVSRDAIDGPVKETQVSRARQTLYWLAQRAGYSMSEVAEEAGRTLSSVTSARDKAQRRMWFCAKWNASLSRLLVHVEELTRRKAEECVVRRVQLKADMAATKASLNGAVRHIMRSHGPALTFQARLDLCKSRSDKAAAELAAARRAKDWPRVIKAKEEHQKWRQAWTAMIAYSQGKKPSVSGRPKGDFHPAR